MFLLKRDVKLQLTHSDTQTDTLITILRLALFDYLFRQREHWRSIVMNTSVCLSVCLSASHTLDLYQFVCPAPSISGRWSMSSSCGDVTRVQSRRRRHGRGDLERDATTSAASLDRRATDEHRRATVAALRVAGVVEVQGRREGRGPVHRRGKDEPPRSVSRTRTVVAKWGLENNF